MEIMSKTKNGQVYICNKCSKIHIEFGNLNFNFSQKEFDDFADYILTLDGNYWKEENKDTPFARKIFIPIGHKNFNVLLSSKELEEMKSLFKFWIRNNKLNKIKYKDIKNIIYKN